MRRAVVIAASVPLLVGPTVLAFFSGAYFVEPRLWAACGAWALVLLVALVAPRPFPASLAGRLAVAGLAAVAAWTAISFGWAPSHGPALDALERALLYLGVLIASIGLLRERVVARAVEPVLAFGATIVIAEGLSGRLLPGIFDLERSFRAGVRLEQPITYWNAEGALAAVGLVLCGRLVGDTSRPAWLRALAAAAAAPLGAGVYLSLSRGAIAAAVVGMLVLVAVAPTRPQLRGVGIALSAAILAAAASAGSGSVSSFHGDLARREKDGLAVLVVFLAIAAGAAAVTWWLARREAGGRASTARVGRARVLSRVAVVLCALIALGLVVGGLQEKATKTQLSENNASRLTSAKSNRYEYWRVGGQAFADHPLNGVGAGGFRVEWLRERTIDEGVLDVHSIELEMASELGIVGLLAFALFVGGIAAAGRETLRRRPEVTAGSIAAMSTFLLHASIDWDWQLPAVTLPAIIMAGFVIATSELRSPAEEPAD